MRKATTGPASGPRPASSTPATGPSWLSSCAKSGIARAPHRPMPSSNSRRGEQRRTDILAGAGDGVGQAHPLPALSTPAIMAVPEVTGQRLCP